MSADAERQHQNNAPASTDDEGQNPSFHSMIMCAPRKIAAAPQNNTIPVYQQIRRKFLIPRRYHPSMMIV